MIGTIIKGVGGLYFVETENDLYECKARGLFRLQQIKPLIGDKVVIDIDDENKKLGTIVEISERKNELVRPAVSNVDTVLVCVCAYKPKINIDFLNKLLLNIEINKISILICVNKSELLTLSEKEILKIYEDIGYKLFYVSVYENFGFDELKLELKDNIILLAGASGVGKTSITNQLLDLNEEVGILSQKLQRGKHTTRHSEIYSSNGIKIIDTPGFTSIELEDMEIEELANYFIEFENFKDKCKFSDCAHIKEQDCAIKKALENKEISQSRYNSYVNIYNELKKDRK